MDRIAVHAITAALCITSSTLTPAAEREWRWRVFENEDRVSLTISQTDLGTDDFGPTVFSCKVGSGRIEVERRMDEHEREAVAELIRKDQYPKIELLPPTPNDVSLVQPSFSELQGWQYKFDIAVHSAAFDEFGRTGIFQVKIGTAVIQNELKAGLENVRKFQDGCRHPR